MSICAHLPISHILLKMCYSLNAQKCLIMGSTSRKYNRKNQRRHPRKHIKQQVTDIQNDKPWTIRTRCLQPTQRFVYPRLYEDSLYAISNQLPPPECWTRTMVENWTWAKVLSLRGKENREWTPRNLWMCENEWVEVEVWYWWIREPGRAVWEMSA